MKYEVRGKFEDDYDDAAMTYYSTDNKKDAYEELYNIVKTNTTVGLEFWIEEYE